MSLDRQNVRLLQSHNEAADGGFMPGTPAERLAQVWELTREVWSFCEDVDPDQPMRRDVVVLVRRGG